MPAGRPRKPTHLKIVSGTAQSCRLNPDEPVASSDLPVPPAHLSERAAAIFRELVVELDGMRIASKTDTLMLSALAIRTEEIETLRIVIEDGGRFFSSSIVKDDSGAVISQQIRSHPAVAQLSDALRHQQSLLSEFGLSPAARSKVSTAKKSKPAANSFKDFA